MIIVIFLVFVYICIYWSYDRPPLYDIISPLISIFIALSAPLYHGLSIGSLILMIGIFLDSIADYNMNVKNLGKPIVLFSWGHILKQIAFGYRNDILYSSIRLGYILASLLVFNVYTEIYIILYTIIIGLTMIQMSNNTMGIVIFVISDIIISVELLGIKIHPKQMRVMLVPILYWISQVCMVKEYSS